MTLIVSFLVAHLGAIIGLLVGASGVVFGMFRHQQANAATDKAAATVAQAQQQVAVTGQQVAQQNAQAAQAQTQAVENAAEAEHAAGMATASTIDQQLAQLGVLRKE